MVQEKVALITGASGIQGRALIRRLEASDEWRQIYGVTRKGLHFGKKVKSISFDLMNKNDVEAKLKEHDISNVTHVFHVAFSGDQTNMTVEEAKMLPNLVEALEASGSKLEHVYATTGTKWYGLHFGGIVKTPFREDDPRHMPPNFYFNVQDYLDERKRGGAKWNWSSLRPNPIIGFGPTSYMSLLQAIAVYGSLSKELGLAFRFPGGLTAYHSLWDCVDVDLLAEAEIWLATSGKGQNDAYNISNGDTFRWDQVWPKIADWFGLEVAPPITVPLAKLMEHHKDTWEKKVKPRYGLEDYPYPSKDQWQFADTTWSATCDLFSDVTKLRRAGFQKMNLYTDEMFRNKLQELVDMKVIPDPKLQGRQLAKEEDEREIIPKSDVRAGA